MLGPTQINGGFEMTKPRRRFALLLAPVLATCAVASLRATPANASYPGEPGRVAYTEQVMLADGGFVREVYTMEPGGSNRRQITLDGGAYVKSVPYPDEPEGSYPLYTMNGYPRWSPDGSMLAYMHYGLDDTFEIRGVEPVSGTTRVLFTDWQGSMISWSPDGQRIAYGDDDGLWVMDSDGSGASLIAKSRFGLWPMGPNHQATVISVEWSPNGQKLAFIEWAGGGLVAGAHHTSVVDVDGSNRFSDICDRGEGSTLDWSPDGETLVCSDGTDLVTVRPDGTGRTPITDGRDPVWSPDGSEIVYTRADFWVDDGSLWSYDTVSGSSTEASAQFSGFDLDWQPIPRIPQPAGLVDPASGIWRLADGDSSVSPFYYGNPGDYPIMGDWDCNSIETPGLYRQSDGFVYLRNSNTQGNADIRFYFGNPGDVPIAGDFNGDGCDTVSIYRQTEGRVYVINSLGRDDGGLGAADYSFYFGNPGDKPFVGDFDGDGTDTVGLHRESTGLVYFRNSNTQGTAELEFYFGNPGDRLIAGDWNGDGNDSPAVYRPSDRTFYFRYTNTQGNADDQFLWGWPHWVPVAAETG